MGLRPSNVGATLERDSLYERIVELREALADMRTYSPDNTDLGMLELELETAEEAHINYIKHMRGDY